VLESTWEIDGEENRAELTLAAENDDKCVDGSDEEAEGSGAEGGVRTKPSSLEA